MGARPTLLFTGASGLVGPTLYARAFSKWRVVLVVHRRSAPAPLRRGDRVAKCDLEESGAAARLVDATEPQAILHAAAIASLPQCEGDPERARRFNVGVTEELARAAAASGAHLVLLSTDHVFDGERGHYRESDEARPHTVYGTTKLAAERALVAAGGESLALRAPLLLAPSASGTHGALDVVRAAIAAAAGHSGDAPSARSPLRLFDDEWRTPLSVLDLARVLDAVLEQRTTGVLHVAGPDRVSRLELGRRIVAAFAPRAQNPAAIEAARSNLVAARRSEAGHPRPRDLSLATERLDREALPRPRPLDDALAELRDFVC
jgi:dTDP-4-dehydrorhamnose reductase